MAELSLFRYVAGTSRIHRMDPRFKLAAVMLLSVAAGLANHLFKLVGLTLFLIVITAVAEISGKMIIGELKRFAFFLLAAVLIQAWGSPGTPPLTGGHWLGLTWEGLGMGLVYAWRLAAVLLIGVLFTGTTRVARIRDAVFWFLQWIPGVPADRVATMFSLILTLIPLVFNQAALIQEAQVTRGSETVTNPLRRLRYLAWPVIRQTLRRADALVLAMEARCYSEQKAPPLFHATWHDWAYFGLTLAVLGVMRW